MIVVRMWTQPRSWFRRLLEGRRMLRGCTLTDGSQRTVEARHYVDTLALFDEGLSTSSICVPRGYQLVVEVSER